MQIVFDTNIFLAVVLDEPAKRSIVLRTIEAEAVAPEIVPYEIGNAITAMVKRKQLTRAQAAQTFDAASTIPVRLVPVDIQQALSVAVEYNLYAYDAYFLQCAMALSCPLMTLDKPLKKVAYDLNIDIVECQ